MLFRGAVVLGLLACASGYIVARFRHMQLDLKSVDGNFGTRNLQVQINSNSVQNEKQEQGSSVQTQSTTQRNEPEIIRGYRRLGHHFYKLVKAPGLDWTDAHVNCQAEGGDLAVINSQEEADFLLELFSKDPSPWDKDVHEAFVGINDIMSEGDFVTVDGEPLSSTGYQKWLRNEPNNGDGLRSNEEDCVTFHKNGGYNDVDCARNMPYFCEVREEKLKSLGDPDDSDYWSN